MWRTIAGWIAGLALLGAVGVGITKAGAWEQALRIAGFQVTTLTFAPASQCKQVRDRVDESTWTVACSNSDRDWARRVLAACKTDPASAQNGQYLFLDDAGDVVHPACPR